MQPWIVKDLASSARFVSFAAGRLPVATPLRVAEAALLHRSALEPGGT
jgi:hypothetical protein